MDVDAAYQAAIWQRIAKRRNQVLVRQGQVRTFSPYGGFGGVFYPDDVEADLNSIMSKVLTDLQTSGQDLLDLTAGSGVASGVPGLSISTILHPSTVTITNEQLAATHSAVSGLMGAIQVQLVQSQGDVISGSLEPQKWLDSAKTMQQGLVAQAQMMQQGSIVNLLVTTISDAYSHLAQMADRISAALQNAGGAIPQVGDWLKTVLQWGAVAIGGVVLLKAMSFIPKKKE